MRRATAAAARGAQEDHVETSVDIVPRLRV